ncbi:MAG: DUF4230 domain-containing protein [Solobacterium sp.]|nr:DUF4230 domain-containing protein [Solobacterium sp.]
MAEKKSSVEIRTKADLVENEATKKRETEAAAIEKKQQEAALKAAEAEEQARKEELERQKKLEEQKAREEEHKAKEAEATAKKEAADKAQKEALLSSGLALAGTALSNTGKNSRSGFLKGLLCGLIAGGLLVYFLFVPTASPAPAPSEPIASVEEADLTLENNGILGYTAADFQNAVLGAASEHQELIVMEQPLSINTTITRAGLGNLAIFSKMQELTYFGTGVYTVDLSHMDEDHISVDESQHVVTIRIPHAILQYVNTELSKTQFEDTEKGLLAFGDISLTAEETNRLETSVYEAMKERLDSPDLYEEADRFAILKTWEIFQPLVSAVSPLYKVEMEFE